MTSKDIGTKILPLSEVVDVGSAKADMVIYRRDKAAVAGDDEDLDKDA